AVSPCAGVGRSWAGASWSLTCRRAAEGGPVRLVLLGAGARPAAAPHLPDTSPAVRGAHEGAGHGAGRSGGQSPTTHQPPAETALAQAQPGRSRRNGTMLSMDGRKCATRGETAELTLVATDWLVSGGRAGVESTNVAS